MAENGNWQNVKINILLCATCPKVRFAIKILVFKSNFIFFNFTISAFCTNKKSEKYNKKGQFQHNQHTFVIIQPYKLLTVTLKNAYLTKEKSSQVIYSKVLIHMQSPTLSDLRDGESGIIKAVLTDNSIKRRLQDLGFIKGEYIERIFTAAMGEPIAYRVRNTIIALRLEDASKIILE